MTKELSKYAVKIAGQITRLFGEGVPAVYGGDVNEWAIDFYSSAFPVGDHDELISVWKELWDMQMFPRVNEALTKRYEIEKWASEWGCKTFFPTTEAEVDHIFGFERAEGVDEGIERLDDIYFSYIAGTKDRKWAYDQQLAMGVQAVDAERRLKEIDEQRGEIWNRFGMK